LRGVARSQKAAALRFFAVNRGIRCGTTRCCGRWAAAARLRRRGSRQRRGVRGGRRRPRRLFRVVRCAGNLSGIVAGALRWGWPAGFAVRRFLLCLISPARRRGVARCGRRSRPRGGCSLWVLSASCGTLHLQRICFADACL